jgi:hypothetical protein
MVAMDAGGGSAAAVAILLLIAFISGVVIGIVLIVSIASRREDRLHSLVAEAPGAVSQGVRRLMGVGTRGGWSAGQPPEAAGDEDWDLGRRGQDR